MDVKSDPRRKVIVVGGGVAGLSTAYLIQSIARERGQALDVWVIEAQDAPGGLTRSEQVSGFLCEWGPNGFLDNEPATLELVKRLSLTDRLVRADEAASRRYIYHSGKLREVPLKPPAFLKSDILPTSAKLRMAMELFVPAKRNGYEESVHAFGARRLGESFAEYLLDPMVSGIFAGNAKELSLPAVFPKMVEMERDYGGLFKAMMKKAREAKRNGKAGGPGGPSGVLHTFRDGMGELTSTLSNKLADRILVSAPVERIERAGGEWSVYTKDSVFRADSVVLACPSYSAAKLIAGLSSPAAKALSEIPFAPVDVVCHGHRLADVEHSLEGFGVLIPRREKIRSLGSLWCNSIFPGQAPLGMHLLRTLVGGAHDTGVINLSQVELEEIVRRDHERLLGVKALPAFSRVIRHERGIAQYTLGHLDRVAEADKLERDLPGLFFTGASYRGVSVNGCVKDAFRVAEACARVMQEVS